MASLKVLYRFLKEYFFENFDIIIAVETVIQLKRITSIKFLKKYFAYKIPYKS